MGRGTICLWYLYPYIYWYFLIFSSKLTVSNGFSLMVWKCVAVTFLSSSFKWGGTICLWYLYPYIYWYFLIFSNKLTVSNGFSLMVWKCVAVTFSSSSFKWGGTICLWYLHVFSAVVFPYIFLLFDCFEWVLIDCIEKRRGHSELWQFQMGGGGGWEGGPPWTHTLTNKQSDLKSCSLH